MTALVLVWVMWHEVALGGTVANSVVILVVTAGAVVVSLTAGAVLTTDARSHRVAPSLIAIVGLLAAIGTLFGFTYPFKARIDEGAWLEASQHAQRVPSLACRPYAQRTGSVAIPGLGAVDTICAGQNGEVSFDRFAQPGVTPNATGVVYSPHAGVPTVEPDSCLRHINGPWWQYRSGAPACPLGFQGVGGG